VSGETAPLVIEISTEDQMHEIGIRLGSLLIAGDVLSLNGPLGAGKTTLTRGIGEGVMVEGNISSPTFLIARTHSTKSGIPFHHIDAYRLSSYAELDDLDIDYAGSISVIEWGSGFAEGLSDALLEINIERDFETDLRTMSISGYGRFANPSEFLGQTK
jgi:alanine racemase/tRNA threonylcarbamoyladenosine biosynthesis protein TsaE